MKSPIQPGDEFLAELHRLLMARAENDMSPEQIERLESLVVSNSEARKSYVEYMLDTSSLHWWAVGENESSCPTEVALACNLQVQSPELTTTGKPAVVPQTPSATHVRWLAIACFLGGVLLTSALLGLWFGGGGRSAQGQLAEGAGRDPSPTAVLVSANGCAWAGERSPFLNSSCNNVGLGEEISLYEGIAEFRLTSGVSLSIEGPATVVLTSPRSLDLQHGKLTVYVPWSAESFRVSTGCSQVVLADGEIGVHSRGNQVTVHAFSGNALIHPLPSQSQPRYSGDKVEDALCNSLEAFASESQLPAGAEFGPVMVSMGRALRLSYDSDSTKVLEWRSAQKTDFASRLSMAGSLPVSSAYVEAIKKAGPLAYWRFESLAQDTVENEVSAGHDLSIVGHVRHAGTRENWSLDLGRPGYYGYCLCKEPLQFSESGDYTIELWAKPSHLHHAGMFVLIEEIVEGNQKRKDALSLETLASNFMYHDKKYTQRFRYMHGPPGGRRVDQSTSCMSKSPYQPRRWHHLVAVKNADRLQLYVDGQLVSKQSDATRFTAPLYAVVGTRYLERLRGKTRDFVTFVGQLDEIAVYDRALVHSEIIKHYKNIVWEPNQRSGNPGVALLSLR